MSMENRFGAALAACLEAGLTRSKSEQIDILLDEIVRLRGLVTDAFEMNSKMMYPQCPFCRCAFTARSEHPDNCPAITPDGKVR